MDKAKLHPPVPGGGAPIVAGAGFVGRGFAGDVEHLTSLIKPGTFHH